MNSHSSVIDIVNDGYKQPLSVLVIICTYQLEVLLLERTDVTPGWQSVTGSVEPGETLQQTAIREVREETGIDARLYTLQAWPIVNHYEIYPFWRHRYAPGVTHNTEHVFSLLLPRAIMPTLAQHEHLNYQWQAYQQAAELVFSPSNAQAIRQLPQMLALFRRALPP